MSPTSFAPFLLGNVPVERVTSMISMMADPNSFCVNNTHTGIGGPNSAMLWRMSSTGSIVPTSGDSISCVTDECLADTVLSASDFQAIEAVVSTSPSAQSSIGLIRFQNNITGRVVLSTSDFAASGYQQLSDTGEVEAYCAPKNTTPELSQPLVLWVNEAGDYRTCGGSQECSSQAMTKLGYKNVHTLCYAYPAQGVADLPCRVALPSIARNDSAFWDQLYWRGRQWAPQTFLVWAGLVQMRTDPAAAAARNALVRKARAQFEQQLRLFGQVNENMNGVLGVGSDSPRVSPSRSQVLHACMC